MQLREAADLIGVSRERVRILIEEGALIAHGVTIKLAATSLGSNEYDISEEELNTFFEQQEAHNPGRHPPVGVRRDLLIEAGYKCAVCSSDAPLQYHHILEWETLKHHDPKHMLAICGVCHDKITRYGSPDIQAQKKIKERLTGQGHHQMILPPKQVPISNPLSPCDKEVVDDLGVPRIVWLLPRGFVLLDDINPEEHAGWSTKAYYYHYGEGWRQGTHYHSSYERSWNLETQAAKLHVALGDRDRCFGPLELVQDIRHQRIGDLQEYVTREQEYGNPVYYFPPHEKIIPAELPVSDGRKGIGVENHDVRDMLAQIKRAFPRGWSGEEALKQAHEMACSLRIRATALMRRITGEDIRSLKFLDEVNDEYHNNMDSEELKAWFEKYRNVLADIYHAWC